MSWKIILKQQRFPNNTEAYHVKSQVWSKAGLKFEDGTPTILELEELLGRKLVKDDFILSSPLNWANAHKFPNVLDRITREGIIEGLRKESESPYDRYSTMEPIEKLNQEKDRLNIFADMYGITLDYTNWDKRVREVRQ